MVKLEDGNEYEFLGGRLIFYLTNGITVVARALDERNVLVYRDDDCEYSTDGDSGSSTDGDSVIAFVKDTHVYYRWKDLKTLKYVNLFIFGNVNFTVCKNDDGTYEFAGYSGGNFSVDFYIKFTNEEFIDFFNILKDYTLLE